MREVHIHKIDLNLLTVFDAVMAEGNLTRAGGRLGLTQSAVSHSLKRLRDLTGDPLFERTRRGVRPTVRATAMAQHVRQAMDLIRATLSAEPSFDPLRAERVFHLDVPAGIEAVVVPRLVERLAFAPKINLKISSGRASAIRNELRFGESYIALDFERVERNGYRSEEVFLDEFVVIARRGHPRLKRGMNGEVYEQLEHVAVHWGRDERSSPLTDAIQQLGIRRNVRLTVPNLSSMMRIVQTSDLVGSTWRRVAQAYAAELGLTILPTPFRLEPVPIFMVWHESFDADAGHAWLRGVMKDIMQGLLKPDRPSSAR
jgi:LysR family transcriptional activator for leuABCD operon